MLTNWIQVEFILGMQGCLKVLKLASKLDNINKLCDHINRLEKAFIKSNIYSHEKSVSLKYKGLSQHHKEHLQKKLECSIRLK